MSYRHEDLVDQNSKATGAALGLLRKIARHVDDKNPGNYAYVSYRKLARSVGIREEDGRWPKEIEREQMLPQLFGLGEIECAESGGPHATNIYFILEPIMGTPHPAWRVSEYPRYDDEEDEAPQSAAPRKKAKAKKGTRVPKSKKVEPEVEVEDEPWRCTCDVPPGKHPSNTECKIWRAADIEASLALEKAQAHKDGKERIAQDEHDILERTRAEINESRRATEDAGDFPDEEWSDEKEEEQLRLNEEQEAEDEERWARQEAEEEAAGKVPAVVGEDDDDDI